MRLIYTASGLSLKLTPKTLPEFGTQGSIEPTRPASTNKETQLRTGLRHGFIYRPMTEWVEATIAWAPLK